MFGMIEKEDEAKRQEVLQRRAANAPAPGAKPKRLPKAASGGGDGSVAEPVSDADAEGGVKKTDSADQSPEGKSEKEPRTPAGKPPQTGRNNAPPAAHRARVRGPRSANGKSATQPLRDERHDRPESLSRMPRNIANTDP
ncbi:hypothetical protein BZL29_5550 [Mycobacterium kansasii]|uniref:Uncharacterized protein n=1 Tax=Mycobacterium kansasii TaxID=1768 RepID=A0A1V3WVX8_MYCKA|nr:hypothetical protein BZL29_5550 [Mycobacterium kansasii]